MRDLIEVERLGIPTVLIVNGPLEAIAIETARAAGMPDLPVIGISVPLIGRSQREITSEAISPLSSLTICLEQQ